MRLMRCEHLFLMFYEEAISMLMRLLLGFYIRMVILIDLKRFYIIYLSLLGFVLFCFNHLFLRLVKRFLSNLVFLMLVLVILMLSVILRLISKRFYLKELLWMSKKMCKLLCLCFFLLYFDVFCFYNGGAVKNNKKGA